MFPTPFNHTNAEPHYVLLHTLHPLVVLLMFTGISGVEDGQERLQPRVQSPCRREVGPAYHNTLVRSMRKSQLCMALSYQMKIFIVVHWYILATSQACLARWRIDVRKISSASRRPSGGLTSSNVGGSINLGPTCRGSRKESYVGGQPNVSSAIRLQVLRGDPGPKFFEVEFY